MEIRLLPMLKRDRQRLRLELRQKEAEELVAKLRAEISAGRQAARAKFPITNWEKILATQLGQSR